MKRSLSGLLLAVLATPLLSSGVAAYCTLGFWKTHREAWCTDTLQLGDVVYDQRELLAILYFDVRQNGLVSLAHQLIAAKLNVACDSADPTTCIEDADALIGSLVVPPLGFGYLTAATTSSLVDCLTAFNEAAGGELCLPTSVDRTSWGRVKATYR
jgi:hypothetical protein